MEKEFLIFGFGRPDDSPALIVDFSALEGAEYERAYEHAYDFCPFGGRPGYSLAKCKSLVEALETALIFGGEYRLYKANPHGEPTELLP